MVTLAGSEAVVEGEHLGGFWGDWKNSLIMGSVYKSPSLKAVILTCMFAFYGFLILIITGTKSFK